MRNYANLGGFFMRSKKRIVLISIVVILLIVGIIIGLCFFFIMKKEKSALIFEASMKEIISGEYDDNFKYISLDGKISHNLSNGDISSAIMQNIDYKIINVEENEDSSIVTAEFTYPNAVEIQNKIVSENSKISEKDLLSKFLDIIKSGDFSTINCTAKIPLICLNNEWYILESEQFSDIITGGIYSEHRKQNEEVYQKLKEIENRK